MTFRIWKSSGLINHLFFSPFFADALFFEHREILSVPLFAPRTPFSQVSSSLAHGLVAYRFAARSRTSRSPRLAATPSAVALLLFYTQKTWVLGCPCLRFSPASAVCGLRSRLASVPLRRHAPSPALRSCSSARAGSRIQNVSEKSPMREQLAAAAR